MSSPYIVDLTVDAVITALAAFMQPFVGSSPMVRGQQNRVAPPPGPFIKLTEILRIPIETPITTGVAGGQINIKGPQRIDIQVDFYGPQAGEQSAAITATYRTEYACSQFPTGISPLYTSDAHQVPLLTAEEQYLQRWTITASLQYNPSLYIPVESATVLGPVSIHDLL